MKNFVLPNIYYIFASVKSVFTTKRHVFMYLEIT